MKTTDIKENAVKTEGGKRAFLLQTALFSSFLFLQFVILRMGNQAGRGFLSDAAQEYVYYAIQVFAVLGFLSFSLSRKRLDGTFAGRLVSGASLAILTAGFFCLALFPCGSAFYLAATAVSVFCLGFIGGFVYLRMAESAKSGMQVGQCMALSYGIAILLQYTLQLRWSVLPAVAVLSVFSAAALFVLLVLPVKAARPLPDEEPAPSAGKAAFVRRIVFACVITAAMLLFTGYYNGYIHHLQIQSGYGSYNVYTWPRLLMIPGYFLFGFLGDFRKGKYLPLGTLCIAVLGFLNVVLTGKMDSYWLNMSLYYVALSAAVSYYNLTFWRLAGQAKRPELWASAGRVLDSLCLLPSAFVRISDLSAGTVLTVNILCLASVIVLMAVNGDLNLTPESGRRSGPESTPASVTPPSCPASSAEEAVLSLQSRYGLTPGETKVFRELVLTEDKQTAIADALSIKLRTVQANVTSIYKKTGVSTRSGLVKLFRDAVSDPSAANGFRADGRRATND